MFSYKWKREKMRKGVVEKLRNQQWAKKNRPRGASARAREEARREIGVQQSRALESLRMASRFTKLNSTEGISRKPIVFGQIYDSTRHKHGMVKILEPQNVQVLES